MKYKVVKRKDYQSLCEFRDKTRAGKIFVAFNENTKRYKCYYYSDIKEMVSDLIQNESTDNQVKKLAEWCKIQSEMRDEYIEVIDVLNEIVRYVTSGLTFDFAIMETYRIFQNRFIEIDKQRKD